MISSNAFNAFQLLMYKNVKGEHMSRWSISGLLLCAAGLVMLGFQVISGVVGQADDWENLSIYDYVDAQHLAWIDDVTWLGMNNALDAIVEAPLYILLLVVGGVCLLISGFVKH